MLRPEREAAGERERNEEVGLGLGVPPPPPPPPPLLRVARGPVADGLEEALLRGEGERDALGRPVREGS